MASYSGVTNTGNHTIPQATIDLAKFQVLTGVQGTPNPSGNTANLNTIFKDPNGDTWAVDKLGNAIKCGAGGVTLDFATNAEALTGTSVADIMNPANTKFVIDANKIKVLGTVQLTPAPFGNTTNLNTVFKDSLGSTYLVDNAGNSIQMGSAQVPTDLGATASPTKIALTSSTGADVDLPLADSINAGLLSPTEKTTIGTVAGKENTSNKVNTLASPSAITFPTTQAVSDALTASNQIADNVSIIGTGFNPNPFSISYATNSQAVAGVNSTNAINSVGLKAKTDTTLPKDIASGAVSGTNLILTLADGTTLPPIDVTTLANVPDVKLQSGVYNATTKALDFTLSNNTIVSVPVSALLPVTTDATLHGNGSTVPLGVEFSADANNNLILGSDNKVYTPKPVVKNYAGIAQNIPNFVVPIVYDTNVTGYQDDFVYNILFDSTSDGQPLNIDLGFGALPLKKANHDNAGRQILANQIFAFQPYQVVYKSVTNEFFLLNETSNLISFSEIATGLPNAVLPFTAMQNKPYDGQVIEVWFDSDSQGNDTLDVGFGAIPLLYTDKTVLDQQITSNMLRKQSRYLLVWNSNRSAWNVLNYATAPNVTSAPYVISTINGNATTSQKINITDGAGNTSNVIVDSLFSTPPTKNAQGQIVLPLPITLDGNNYNVVASNAIPNIAPTAVEVATPINGDTATKFLIDNKIEYWAYTSSWALIKTVNPTTLDGNDTHVLRANATTNVAPTSIEVPTPMNGDTAKVRLTNGVVEFWKHNGTAWSLDFSTDKATVGYGTTIPTTQPTDRVNDTFVRTSDGVAPNANASNLIAQYVFDGTAWRLITKNPDYIVNISGATLPVTFPVTTIPGTPTFAPNLPQDPNVTYRLANGKLATWNGTQYVADNPEPSEDYWRNLVGSLADGTNDTTEDIRRDGKVGLNADPKSTLDVLGSFGNGTTNTTTATYTTNDTDHTIFLNSATTQAITIMAASGVSRREYVFVNNTNVAKTTSIPFNSISGGTSNTIPPFSTVTIQSDGTSWKQTDGNGQFNGNIIATTARLPIATIPSVVFDNYTVSVNTTGSIAGSALWGLSIKQNSATSSETMQFIEKVIYAGLTAGFGGGAGAGTNENAIPISLSTTNVTFGEPNMEVALEIREYNLYMSGGAIYRLEVIRDNDVISYVVEKIGVSTNQIYIGGVGVAINSGVISNSNRISKISIPIANAHVGTEILNFGEFDWRYSISVAGAGGSNGNLYIRSAIAKTANDVWWSADEEFIGTENQAGVASQPMTANTYTQIGTLGAGIREALTYRICTQNNFYIVKLINHNDTHIHLIVEKEA
jgi:hypothetical protein